MKSAQIELATTFGEDIEQIKSDSSISREDREAILDALAEAIKRLYDWNIDAPHAYGDAYVYKFHPNYEITFKRKETAKEVILRLYTIQGA